MYVYFTYKDDLEAMRAELSKQCRIWKETPLRPDITKTKNLMHRISLRWQYLVQQATAVDVSILTVLYYVISVGVSTLMML